MRRKSACIYRCEFGDSFVDGNVSRQIAVDVAGMVFNENGWINSPPESNGVFP
jgi:hypothetical protein